MFLHQDLNKITVGKQLQDDVYVHESAVDLLPEGVRKAVLEHWPSADGANIVKLSKRAYKISYLYYPEFEKEAHPALARSVVVDLLTRSQKVSDFAESHNPPILHRKETFVASNHPLHETFRQLTIAEEEAGLFEYPKKIGFLREWERLLKRMRLRIEDHQLVEEDTESQKHGPFEGKVARHRTAIVRYEPSRPVKSLLAHGLLDGKQLFDYGCGQGDDIEGLRKAGFTASGWDPYFAPDSPREPAEVVNLGFVLNIIEDPKERTQALKEAWNLAKDLLVVSVMHESQARNADFRPFGDGILTSRNTFQKFYSQEELQSYLEKNLGAESISVSLGIFYVFKRDDLKQAFIAQTVKREIDWKELSARERKETAFVPRLSKYQKHQGLFDSFWHSCLTLGRIPRASEFEHYDSIRQVAGSLPKAIQILGEKYDLEALEEARTDRAEDLLVYFCMAHFRKRVPFKLLPESLQYDIKGIFGNYTTLEEKSMSMLLNAGDAENIEAACNGLPFGRNDEEFFQFHSSYLPKLPVLLRVYVSCGSILYGGIEEADIIKIHKGTGKLSLMFYKNFWRNAHPELKVRIKLLLRTQEVEVYDYSTQEQVQLLYEKETYFGDDHPKYKLFSKLTQQEKEAGLLEFSDYGPDKEIWQQILESKGLEIRGHKLVEVT